jgi:hypothetical protein
MPLVWVKPGITTPRHILGFLAEAPYITWLMIAGNRESRDPGIGERVEQFLIVVFKSLAGIPRPIA